jgi:hypothetical protein
MNLKIIMDTIYNFIAAFIGTFTGAAVIVYFDVRRRTRQSIQKNFKSALSIQLALNQMLNVALQMYHDYDLCKINCLHLYQNLKYQDPRTMWDKFKNIDLRKFYQTYTYIDLNWDLKQFLSHTTDDKRHLLSYLIQSRAIYQHINSILEIRNSFFDKASQLVSNYSKSYPELAYKIYEHENLLEILGIKLHSELKSITDEYIRSILDGTQIIYNAFEIISKYINIEFSPCQPLELQTPENIKKILDKLITHRSPN